MKLPFNIDLKDKVCVVTGGTGILCGAMADALAECGAKIAILALGQEACDNKAKEINEKGGIAIGIAIGGFLVDGFGVMSIFTSGILFLLLAFILLCYVILILKVPLKY